MILSLFALPPPRLSLIPSLLVGSVPCSVRPLRPSVRPRMFLCILPPLLSASRRFVICSLLAFHVLVFFHLAAYLCSMCCFSVRFLFVFSTCVRLCFLFVVLAFRPCLLCLSVCQLNRSSVSFTIAGLSLLVSAFGLLLSRFLVRVAFLAVCSSPFVAPRASAALYGPRGRAPAQHWGSVARDGGMQHIAAGQARPLRTRVLFHFLESSTYTY